MCFPPFSIVRFLAVGCLALSFCRGSAFAADAHSSTVDTAAFKAVFDNGWLVSWTNKRTGETLDFGKPENAASLPDTYQPGGWVIPGYGQETKEKSWALTASAGGQNELILQQQLDVKDGLAQAVQWSMRLPLDKIDGSYWPTGLTNRMLARDGKAEGALGKNYYFGNRMAVLSSHQWRERYFVVQGQKGGIIIQVDDPALDHFNAVEMEDSKFPREVVLTQRSIASPNWASHYEGSKWTITQYDGWVNNAAQIRRDYIVKAFDLKPLAERPTAWAQNLAFTWVRAPFTTPPLSFPGTANSPDYTENWDENLKLVDQWLDNLAKVVEPDKVMFYVNWWRYAAHDTMFPEHSIDPFFAFAVGHARKRGYHVMLHFHNHLAQDGVTTFFGRYIAKQDEWHRAAHPDRPNAVGDPEGKIMWGVGYDFLRRMEVVQRDKEFGTPSSARQGLPIRMTGYHMSPAYEGWRHFKVAEILSAIRATGADAIHIDVPAVWPEGKERFGINSQQGSREFFKLLRQTLDENGLSHVAIATEASPGEGYMRYVDMAQLVRGSSTVSLLDGIATDTMIELQLGDDLDKAQALRSATKTRYPSAEEKKIKESLRFDAKAIGASLAQMRELSEPNVDAMVISPFVRAYPHLGSASPLMGGYPGDPAAAVHNQAAQSLHVWATVQRDAPFNFSPTIQMFMDAPPWDSLNEIKAARKEAIKSGKRTQGRVFNQFNYTQFALVRWWEKFQPRFAPLPEWKKGDIARFKTNDGKLLSVRELDPLTIRFALGDKPLADLNVFEGWKNADALKPFNPTFLDNQIDPPASPAP